MPTGNVAGHHTEHSFKVRRILPPPTSRHHHCLPLTPLPHCHQLSKGFLRQSHDEAKASPSTPPPLMITITTVTICPHHATTTTHSPPGSFFLLSVE